MVDPVYTLVRLTGLDPENTQILGISIMDNYLVVWYLDEKGTSRHMSVQYEI